jgi:hypothetical protein
LTVHAAHSGQLATLVASCKLCLPLGSQHASRPFPASHIRGRNQIDFILVSKALLPSILRSGVMAHQSLTRGDHLPYYIDLEASKLFSDPAYNIEPATVRKLRLQDPRVVKKYRSALHDRLESHDVFNRLEMLQDKLTKHEWTANCIDEYEKLDATITESMLSAEKDISKRVTCTYQWSPKLKIAVQKLRYWNLRLCQVQNQPVSANQLNKFYQEGAITESDKEPSTEQDIKVAQHQAFQHLKTLQQQHQELRDTYLEDLAEAIVLDCSPKIEERLSTPYDIMAVWIRLVEEAIQVLQHHTASLRAEAHQIFPQQNEASDPESDSTYTSESEESDDTLSLAPTETTAATTNSSSTNDLLSSSSITLLVSGDDSNISYDDDALSLTSVPSIDTGSSNVEFTSVAFEDLDRHSAT